MRNVVIEEASIHIEYPELPVAHILMDPYPSYRRSYEYSTNTQSVPTYIIVGTEIYLDADQVFSVRSATPNMLAEKLGWAPDRISGYENDGQPLSLIRWRGGLPDMIVLGEASDIAKALLGVCTNSKEIA